MLYSNVNNDQELIKIKTKDDETRELTCRTKNYDHENNHDLLIFIGIHFNTNHVYTIKC